MLFNVTDYVTDHSPIDPMTKRRSIRPVRRLLVVLCALLLGMSSCASEPEKKEPEGSVGAAPEERDEPPVWAEGPAYEKETSDEAEEGASDKSTGDRSREAPAEKPRRSGTTRQRLRGVFPSDTITLDFRNTSVRRVMRIFRAKAKIELVVKPEITDRITIETDEIPLIDAFLAVLEAADLTILRRENVVFIEPRSDAE